MLTIEAVVDTTELDRLIARLPSRPLTRIVSDGVEYGKYQEFGTSKMAARPCARPAVEAVRPGFLQAWRAPMAFWHADDILDKAASDVEREWKRNIIDKNVVDTGAYLNSIHVVGG